jgi:hypothetical protein
MVIFGTVKGSATARGIGVVRRKTGRICISVNKMQNAPDMGAFYRDIVEKRGRQP